MEKINGDVKIFGDIDQKISHEQFEIIKSCASILNNLGMKVMVSCFNVNSEK